MKSIIRKFKNKINYYKFTYYVKKLIGETLNKINATYSRPRIYYFLTPTHSNLGDQAQLLCWLRFFKQWYPDYEVIQIPLVVGTDEVFIAIKSKITTNDLVYIHSGYLVCDLYNNWQMLCRVIDEFYDNKITILPQTVHFLSSKIQEQVAKCFNKHSKLHLICRDRISYSKAMTIFSKNEISLKPDVVTSLIGTNFVHCSANRNGVLFCMRNDAEKLYTDEEINHLKAKLNGVFINNSDTTIIAKIWDWPLRREQFIKDFLLSFSKYQVIVTDRYHGTIFSQIVDTPVVVLASTDHKLKSGVNWFPRNIFHENIMFANDLCEAYELIKKVLDRKGKIIENPTYFLDNYFSNPI